MENYTAVVSTTITTSLAKAWQALIDPRIIKEYMFGTEVVSDWNEGATIIWKGEWQGKPHEDKGVIKKIEPEQLIQYTHFSPLEGKTETVENIHTITITLSSLGNDITVTLSQDNNQTVEARRHSEKNWQMMLDGMKKFLEQSSNLK
ncbi:MAG: SRPBCC domain-containing protein [Patescibacteria group bacterium]